MAYLLSGDPYAEALPRPVAPPKVKKAKRGARGRGRGTGYAYKSRSAPDTLFDDWQLFITQGEATVGVDLLRQTRSASSEQREWAEKQLHSLFKAAKPGSRLWHMSGEPDRYAMLIDEARGWGVL